MATTPIPVPTAATPTPATTSTALTTEQQLQASLAALANRHANVSYTLIGILILVLVVGGFGAYFANKFVDKEIAAAKTAEGLYDQQKVVAAQATELYQKELASHDADRTKWAQQEATLVTQYKTRTVYVQQQIAAVTAPGKSAQDVYADLHTAYKDNPPVASVPLAVSADPLTQEQLLTFPVTAVQQFTATKIDDDAQKENVDNLNQQLNLKQAANDSLTTDLASANGVIADDKVAIAAADKTIKDYKKVVAPSRFKRIMGGVLKGALFVGGVALGHYL
jgi:hypothetical protein